MSILIFQQLGKSLYTLSLGCVYSYLSTYTQYEYVRTLTRLNTCVIPYVLNLSVCPNLCCQTISCFLYLYTLLLTLKIITGNTKGNEVPFRWRDDVRPYLCGTAATNGFIVRPTDKTCVNVEEWRNKTDSKNRRITRETCPSATLSTTNSTWITLGLRG
jgi:hypothetical protein